MDSKMQKTKEIDIEVLPPKVKAELLDFYEYLVHKYCDIKSPRVNNLLERKKLFFVSLKKHSFKIPDNYKFCREELHER